jgi:hypothetical protein
METVHRKNWKQKGREDNIEMDVKEVGPQVI